MRGIVLAGGRGTRLWPITRAMNKQLLPIHDKPMIHYPIATLMTAGITEILVITNPEDGDDFNKLLGDGSNYGIRFEYAVQPKPGGLAEALLIGSEFIGDHSVALILGDNIFHGPGLGRRLEEFANPKGATVFAYHVSDPTQYGVVQLDSNGQVQSIEEKPAVPKSNWAIPGLYFFDSSCVERAKHAVRSQRNELEITSVLNSYLQDKILDVSILPRGTAWLDTGTVGNLNDAATYFRLLEDRQGTKVSCLEEVAWRLSLITSKKLQSLAESFKGSPYGHYLESLLLESHTREW
jgi:glucose-1-phosphate thymidylyltransferase